MRAHAVVSMRARFVGVLLLTLAMLPLSAMEFVAWAEVPEVVSREVGFRTDTSAMHAAGVGTGPATLRSTPTRGGQRFSSIGFELPEGAEAYFRTADPDGVWSPWWRIPLMDVDEGPDAASSEADGEEPGRVFSDALWVGDAADVQIQVEGARPEDVEATLIDAAGLNGAGTVRIRVQQDSADAAPADGLRPSIIRRSQWGADESMRRGGPNYAARAGAGIVHHTAGRNDYSAADVPAIIRAIYSYHVNSRRWSDIAYNFLVDRFGRVYEGRYGGMERAVIGAHARNYNTGSIGISVLGNFSTGAVPSAAMDSIAKTLAWKYALHGIDPYGKFRFPITGDTRATLLGHTDVGSTACPGDIQRQMSKLRGMIAAAMLPFRDVLTDGAHYGAIARLWSDGYVSGCTSELFCPWLTLTRAQAATMISKAFAIPPSDRNRFDDVDAASPHRTYINGLAEAGLITGFDDGFRPRGTLTRGQLATILRGVLSLEPAEGDKFVDVPSRYPHAGAIYALHDAKILSGCTRVEGGFCPGDAILRAQMSSMVNNSLNWVAAQIPPEEPPEEPTEEPTEGGEGGEEVPPGDAPPEEPDPAP